MIKVVCGIIMKENKVFICRRNINKPLGGYWEFPGGKIEAGELQEDALIRELDEELGMKVNIGLHFKTVVHAYEKFTIELIALRCEFQGANFNMTDHDSYEWVNVDELNKWRLAPADIPIANELIKNQTV